MQDSLSQIGCQPLRHLCLPGSHDTGMSTLDGHTSLSNDQNTKTQNLDVAGQLAQGARYFDIRPVIAGGHYKTGHYTKVGPLYQGGNGQTIDSIVQQINDYLDQNRELVVLELSHTFDTDHNYKAFNQSQWDGLFQSMSDLKYLFGTPPSMANMTNNTDISKIPLAKFITHKAAVIIVVRASSANLGSYANRGFYTDAQYPMYNKNSDTNHLKSMSRLQIQQMQTQRTNLDWSSFLLSWTLTQKFDDYDVAGKTIIDMAQKAYPWIFGTDLSKLGMELWSSMSNNTFPNVISIDAWSPDQRLTGLCMAINSYFAPSCS